MVGALLCIVDIKRTETSASLAAEFPHPRTMPNTQWAFNQYVLNF